VPSGRGEGARGSFFESVSLVSHRPGHPRHPLPIRGLFQLQHWRAVTGRRAERWRAGGDGSLPAAPGSATLAPTVVRCGRGSLRRGVRSTFGLVTGLYFYASASPIQPMGLSSGPYSVFYFIVVSTWF